MRAEAKTFGRHSVFAGCRNLVPRKAAERTIASTQGLARGSYENPKGLTHQERCFFKDSPCLARRGEKGGFLSSCSQEKLMLFGKPLIRPLSGISELSCAPGLQWRFLFFLIRPTVLHQGAPSAFLTALFAFARLLPPRVYCAESQASSMAERAHAKELMSSWTLCMLLSKFRWTGLLHCTWWICVSVCLAPASSQQ